MYGVGRQTTPVAVPPSLSLLEVTLDGSLGLEFGNLLLLPSWPLILRDLIEKNMATLTNSLADGCAMSTLLRCIHSAAQYEYASILLRTSHSHQRYLLITVPVEHYVYMGWYTPADSEACTGNESRS